MTMDIPLILDHIRPGSEWGWLGEDKSDYANLDWRDTVQAKPTLTEVEAGWLTAQNILAIESEAAVILDGVEARYKSTFFKTVMEMTEDEIMQWVEDTVESAVQANYPGTYSIIKKMARFLAIAKDTIRPYIVAELRAEQEE